MGPTEFRHGRRIGLDALFVRLPGAPTHVIDTGLDLTGEAPGRLHGWFPTVKVDGSGLSNTRSATRMDGANKSNPSTSSCRPTHYDPTEKANTGSQAPAVDDDMARSVALSTATSTKRRPIQSNCTT